MAEIRKLRSEITIKKVIMVIIGISIMAQGIDFFIMTGVGIDPISVFVQGLSQQIGVSFGIAQTILNVFVLIIPLCFFRKYIGLTTVLTMFMLGPFFDLYTFLEGSLITPELDAVYKIILIVVGQTMFSFGLATYLSADMGGSPCDTPSVIVSKMFNIKYGYIRVVSDGFFLIAGFMLGGTLGIGTVIAVICTGPLSQFFRKITNKFYN